MADKSEKPVFNASEPDAIEVVRRAFWGRLKVDTNFRQIENTDSAFSRYVEFARERDQEEFRPLLLQVFWEFVLDGIVCPGTASGQLAFPFFQLTEHGARVLKEPTYVPHDAIDYMVQLGKAIPAADPTVLAYLREALNCYKHRTIVASMMMLGIAAERVFEILCDSLLAALTDPNERTTFQRILARFPMKPKQDWVTAKFQRIQTPRRPAGFPDDTDIVVLAVFNLIRNQRNDLGHPQPSPPVITRDLAYGHLRMFPSYYETVEQLRQFFAVHPV